jgi:hypothetical protein
MKASVYLETTVISYLNGRATRDLVIGALQVLTLEWWEKRRDDFELFVSESVIREAGRGAPIDASRRLDSIKGISVLAATEEAALVAKKLIQGAHLPQKAAEDALHIAIAAVNDIDYLLTWNCKHIANALTVSRVEEVCRINGFQCPRICTPQELMEVEE